MSQTPSLLGSLPADRSSQITLAVDDIEGIYRLSNSDRERALDRLMLHLQEPQEEPYLTDLYERWVILDYRRAADSLVSLFENHEQRDDALGALLGELMLIPVSAWMLDDPAGAKAWAKQLPRTSYAEAFAFEAVLIEIAKRHHQDAWEWLAQRPFNGQRAFEHLVVQVTKTLSVEDALGWFGSLPTDPAFEGLQTSRAGLRADQAADRSRAELWKRAVNQLFQDDREAVGQWVAQLPASTAADEALNTFASVWAAEEPQQAAEWALSLEQSNRVSAVQAVATAWAGDEPSKSVQWSIDLDDEGLRWSALGSAFTVWIDQVGSRQDGDGLAEAANWLSELAEEPQAASLFEAMSQSLPPAESIRWAETLTESDNRALALDQGHYRIGRDDPDAALRLLEDLSLDGGERAAEMISLGAMIAGQREALAEWRSQLSKESPLFYGSMKAEIQLAATFDPEQAGRVIHTLPATRQRDALIIALIERIAGRSASHADQAMAWTDELVQRELRVSLREYIDQAQERSLDLAPLPEDAGRMPFAKQTLTQLRLRLDHASHRRSPFRP